MKSPTFYFGLETHKDGGTKIGTHPENIAIGKIMKGSEISNVFRFWPLMWASRGSVLFAGIVTGLRVESVTVTEIGVTEKEGIVTATKATVTGER